MSSDNEDWANEYQFVVSNPPEADSWLKAKDGPIKLNIVLTEGRQPLIYTKAYVPNTVGCDLDWFAQGTEDQVENWGWKVIIAPRSAHDVAQRLGLNHEFVAVETIRILRMSVDKRCLIGEVIEWCKAATHRDEDSRSPQSNLEGNNSASSRSVITPSSVADSGSSNSESGEVVEQTNQEAS